LQILIRLTQERQFKAEFEKPSISHSVASKKLSKLFEQFPPEKLVFTSNILNDKNFESDIIKLFERLSNFIVENSDNVETGKAYFSMDQHNSWIINMPACTCFSEAQSSDVMTCQQCHVSKFPSYNISNLITSDISRLLKVKAEIFNTEFCRMKVDSIMKGKAMSLTDSGQVAQKGVKPSIQVLSSVHVNLENEAHEQFRANLEAMANTLDTVLLLENSDVDFSMVTNNPLLLCIAKILGYCSKEMKTADRKEGYRMGHPHSSNMFYDLMRQYIRYLYRIKTPFYERLRFFEEKLDLVCVRLDQIWLNSDEAGFDAMNDEQSAEVIEIKEDIKRLQKIRLIGTKVTGFIEELINNNYTCVFDLEN
jgi:hypothetical protein